MGHHGMPTYLMTFPKPLDDIQFNCKRSDNLCSAIIAIRNNRKTK